MGAHDYIIIGKGVRFLHAVEDHFVVIVGVTASAHRARDGPEHDIVTEVHFATHPHAHPELRKCFYISLVRRRLAD